MKIPKHAKQIFLLFAFWRIGLFLVTYLGSKVFPQAYNGGLGAPTFTRSFDYWLSWAQWDGGYYFEIARRGYLFLQDYAFFPLYPILIRFLGKITSLDLLASGLIISNLSFLAFLLIFFKFLKENYSKSVAISTVVTFMCFPTTFFAVANYSEGLFLMLTAAAFLNLGQKKYLSCAVAIILAAQTRLAGSFLIISFLYSYASSIAFSPRKINSKVLFVIFSSLGVCLYAIYQFYKLNNPFGFISLQDTWQRTTNDPFSTIFGHIFKLLTDPNQPFDQYLDLVVTVVFLGLLVSGAKKIKSSLWIFSMLVILIPVSSGTLTSMPRYALGSLGAFVVLGDILERHPKYKRPFWAISLGLQAILALRFVTGYWVA